MREYPINELVEKVMDSIKKMIDVNTIVGESVETPDGTVIIPVSRVGFGFAVGGSDFSKAKDNEDLLFGGGSGAGVSISPVGFLVVAKDQVRLIPVTNSTTSVDKLIDYLPVAFDKISALVKKDKEDSQE
ncbi:MAG: GerW family sporulation protein [Clostridia bacterium]|nr:GerW family sporulation protein [Clostridia bacterium]